MASLPRIAGAVLGSTTLAAFPAGATTVLENEPFNNTFPGQSVAVGDTVVGSNDGNTDPIDFFDYTGLPVGKIFDFKVFRDPCCNGTSFLLDAGLYTGQNTEGASIDLNFGETKDLTGLVPAGGNLTLGVKLAGAGSFEGYQVTLSVIDPNRIPEPAAIALLTAGLAGLEIVRRRKRR